MDAKNDVLFDLIKSLTKTEKRFIKLNAQFHQGDKTYLRGLLLIKLPLITTFKMLITI